MRGNFALILFFLLIVSVFYFPEVFSSSLRPVKVTYCELELTCPNGDARLENIAENAEKLLTENFIFFDNDGAVSFKPKLPASVSAKYLCGPWKFYPNKEISHSNKNIGKLVVSLNGFSNKDELLANWKFLSRNASGSYRSTTPMLEETFVPKSSSQNLARFVAENLAFNAMTFD
jgi:hypothetical protein